MKLVGKKVYLAVLEKEDCRTLWKDFEYDFAALTEPLNIGHSLEKADDWFDEIQKNQGQNHIRLGIFLHSNEVIGDVALQEIDWKNRTSDIGLGIAKLENLSKGYGSEAINLLLEHAFNHLGLERVSANTLEQNKGAQGALDKLGFKLEGVERQAVYFAGKRWNRLNYGLLRDEYNSKC